MSGCLALGAGEVLLRGINNLDIGCVGCFVGEEALEDTLRLPFGRIAKVDPHVHSPRSAKRGIESLNVICCGKKKTSGDALVPRQAVKKKKHQ